MPGGEIILPERIRRERRPYYEALSEGDQAWDKGELLLPKIESYLARFLDEQILDIAPPNNGNA